MVIIQNNNGDEYPYITICGQQGYEAQKIQNKLIDFPNGQIAVLAETPNSIVHYNWLRERGCIEVNPDRVRHFRLGTMTQLTHCLCFKSFWNIFYVVSQPASAFADSHLGKYFWRCLQTRFD